MKTKTTARCFALGWLMVISTITIVGYTLLLKQYFHKGLDLSNTYMLEFEARDFERAYRQNHDAPLPQSPIFSSYLGLYSLPDWVLQEFPPESHEPLKTQRVEWWPEGVEKNTDNKHILFLYPFDLYDGTRLFFLQHITPEHAAKETKARFNRITSTIWPVALIFIVFSFIGIVILIQTFRKPVEQLSDWADSLTLENKDQPRPHFRYREHDLIAEKLQQAFQRIGEVIESEHQFLRHASHELRTPIAVLRSNIELLNHMKPDCEMEPRAAAPWQRIDRAVSNMQHMTETLLWLSRNEPIDNHLQPIPVDKMLQQLIEENSYLLQGKEVELTTELPPTTITTAEMPCRIALNNLIRNAFQYTTTGWVKVQLTNEGVVISNANTECPHGEPNGTDIGFGLGLKLVKKICGQMGWKFQSDKIFCGRRAVLRF